MVKYLLKAMAEPTPAKMKSKVEMNSAMYDLMEAKLHESPILPIAIPGIFFSFLFFKNEL